MSAGVVWGATKFFTPVAGADIQFYRTSSGYNIVNVIFYNIVGFDISYNRTTGIFDAFQVGPVAGVGGEGFGLGASVQGRLGFGPDTNIYERKFSITLQLSGGLGPSLIGLNVSAQYAMGYPDLNCLENSETHSEKVSILESGAQTPSRIDIYGGNPDVAHLYESLIDSGLTPEEAGPFIEMAMDRYIEDLRADPNATVYGAAQELLSEAAGPQLSSGSESAAQAAAAEASAIVPYTASSAGTSTQDTIANAMKDTNAISLGELGQGMGGDGRDQDRGTTHHRLRALAAAQISA